MKSLVVLIFSSLVTTTVVAAEFFEIQVVDEATGRGVPLVELKTTNHLQFITDSAGRIAFGEAELMDREVFFHVSSHGYEYPKDGFGIRGVRLTPKPGERAEIKLKRINIAERLYRLTGEGVYRDTLLLGKPAPMKPHGAGIVGQDSAQLVQYQDKVYWFFGDTTLARYPLGVFRMTGATSTLPKPGEKSLVDGIELTYFKNKEGLARAMMPLPSAPEGVVWIDGLAVVPDRDGELHMVGRYERLRGLGEPIEQGMCTWDDDQQIFQRTTTHPMTETHLLKGAPILHRERGTDYIYCGMNMPMLRVRATLPDVLDTDAYEAWTCLDESGKVVRDDQGRPQFAWRKNAVAWTPALDAKHLRESEYQLHPRDVATGKPIKLHHGSVRWNKHRQKWIAIVSQQEGTSFLGETWYSEADAPTGPWLKAVKIVTHDKYSFYNPVHHDFFDEGSTIYFQGTYAHTFSGTDDPTPRYDYNQIMYRLDLDDERLAKAR